jgi:hypothetical protein
MTRVIHAWRALRPEQRLAALAAVGLFVSMLLPWYSETSTLVEHNAAKAGQSSLSAFQAFSFVEAAVLLVSAGVLAMLFARGEARDFRLPGGDGLVVTVAGGWTAVLIFYRLLDKPGLRGNQRLTSTVGVEWGIFIALLLAIGLAYAGSRMRGVERHRPERARRRAAPSGPDRDPSDPGPRSTTPEPRAPAGEDTTVLAARPNPQVAPSPSPSRAAPRPAPVPARPRPRYPPAPGGQLSFEDDPPGL